MDRKKGREGIQRGGKAGGGEFVKAPRSIIIIKRWSKSREIYQYTLFIFLHYLYIKL